LTAEGADGVADNPAAGSVLPFGKLGGFIADGSFLLYVGDGKSDFVNDGLSTGFAQVDSIVGLAAVIGYGRWTLAVDTRITSWSAATAESAGLETRGMQQGLEHFALARAFGDSLSLGVGFRYAAISFQDNSGTDIATLDATGAEAGAVWRPSGRNIRLGFGAWSEMSGSSLSVSGAATCSDALACDGLILPNRIRVPWQMAVGIAWRVQGPTWNVASETRYRDERVLTLAADVVVSGTISDGYSVGSYLVDGTLQPSGRSISVSPRLGLENEAIPGRLRMRVGGYYEPGRTPDSSYRRHFTGGVELRLLSLFQDRVRVQANAGFDAAAGYGATSASIGLWH
jgi:hypothetical protein